MCVQLRRETGVIHGTQMGMATTQIAVLMTMTTADIAVILMSLVVGGLNTDDHGLSLRWWMMTQRKVDWWKLGVNVVESAPITRGWDDHKKRGLDALKWHSAWLQISVTDLLTLLLYWTVFTQNRDTAVPAEGNGDLWRDPDDVPHCRILSPGKTEWRLISATLCGWRRCFVADQLWFMTCIWEEEEVSVDLWHTVVPFTSDRCVAEQQQGWLWGTLSASKGASNCLPVL